MSDSKNNVLNIKVREVRGTGGARQIRREKSVPAIVYGAKEENLAVSLDAIQWSILAKTDIRLVELKQDKGDNIDALIKDVQYNCLTGKAIHVDFQRVKMDEEITASIPINGLGEPVGLAQGGILEQMMHELEVTALPKALPEVIEVDISGLELSTNLTLAEITLPPGVTTSGDPDHVIFNLAQPAEEEEETSEAVEGEEGVEGEEATETEEEAAE